MGAIAGTGWGAAAAGLGRFGQMFMDSAKIREAEEERDYQRTREALEDELARQRVGIAREGLDVQRQSATDEGAYRTGVLRNQEVGNLFEMLGRMDRTPGALTQAQAAPFQKYPEVGSFLEANKAEPGSEGFGVLQPTYTNRLGMTPAEESQAGARAADDAYRERQYRLYASNTRLDNDRAREAADAVRLARQAAIHDRRQAAMEKAVRLATGAYRLNKAPNVSPVELIRQLTNPTVQAGTTPIINAKEWARLADKYFLMSSRGLPPELTEGLMQPPTYEEWLDLAEQYAINQALAQGDQPSPGPSPGGGGGTPFNVR